MASERREVTYRGHVQGVGFRYTACQLARGYQVAGFVENLPDGRVRLVAEGEAAELARFLAAIDDRLGNHVREAAVSLSPASGEFDGFEIRY